SGFVKTSESNAIHHAYPEPPSSPSFTNNDNEDLAMLFDESASDPDPSGRIEEPLDAHQDFKDNEDEERHIKKSTIFLEPAESDLKHMSDFDFPIADLPTSDPDSMPDGAASTKSGPEMLEGDVVQDGVMAMYWIDAYEKNGTVFVFGKVDIHQNV